MREYDGSENVKDFLDRKLRELTPVEFPLYNAEDHVFREQRLEALARCHS